MRDSIGFYQLVKCYRELLIAAGASGVTTRSHQLDYVPPTSGYRAPKKIGTFSFVFPPQSTPKLANFHKIHGEIRKLRNTLVCFGEKCVSEKPKWRMPPYFSRKYSEILARSRYADFKSNLAGLSIAIFARSDDTHGVRQHSTGATSTENPLNHHQSLSICRIQSLNFNVQSRSRYSAHKRTPCYRSKVQVGMGTMLNICARLSRDPSPPPLPHTIYNKSTVLATH